MFKVVERLKEKNEIFYPKKIREAPPLSPPVHVGEERATSKFDNHGLNSITMVSNLDGKKAIRISVCCSQ